MPPPIRGGGITIVARASSIQFPLSARPVTFLCFSVSTIILNAFYLNFMQRSDGCDGNGWSAFGLISIVIPITMQNQDFLNGIFPLRDTDNAEIHLRLVQHLGGEVCGLRVRLFLLPPSKRWCFRGRWLVFCLYSNDFHKIWWRGGALATEETVRFLW